MNKTFRLTILAMMISLTAIMVVTPIGTISIGAISITIAHIPILIVTLLFGLKEGLIIAFSFGLFSLLKALLAPIGILDPLFINPMVSILPRLMIPITTYFSYLLLAKTKKYTRIVIAVVVGNLTNTFFVYFSMFLFTKDRVESLMGSNFGTVILGLVSTVTLIKTVGVVLVTVPVVVALQKYLGKDIAKISKKSSES